MKEQRRKNTRKRIAKQLLGASIAWITGIALVGFALTQVKPVELVELKFIPVYAIALLSAVGLGWYYYTYQQLRG
ncbi:MULTISPECIES: hypothetical protein [unclassified Leeuwenhoekiella]|uniref:hypothetical protein n=1 Tax=unclassified Leeuwenhoekiella TaxID=2615029 RepID=UPI000C49FA7E|nr:MULTISPECIES: hypothetical protein [unclassified Leeuwenhoekiella]MAW93847.1 hypothetical protein [Leeuwenhoekiella sp.]MBA82254.1 hypothetical protein [Leeuwenhoekiella sp.]|tara:strand:- start:206 stop:430 length:225 start_codon:yes stop_codon:yes gene_type:complete